MEDKGGLVLLNNTFTGIIASYKKEYLTGIISMFAKALDNEGFKEKEFQILIVSVKEGVNIKPQRDRIITQLTQLAELKRSELRKYDHPKYWSVICPLCEKNWSTENKHEQLEKNKEYVHLPRKKHC